MDGVTSGVLDAFLASFEAAEEAASKLTWPSPKYKDDPAGFAWDIFGIRLHPDQINICLSVVDHRRTACVACHKAGKT